MSHHFELYQDKAGKFRFRFRANNGNIMASSSDAFADKEDAMMAIQLIKDGKPTTEVYVDALGEYRWRMRIDGDIIATGSEGYSQGSSCSNSLESVCSRAAAAEVIEM